MPRRSDAIFDPVDVAVGARIRLFRKLRGLSQQALAECAGVTFQQIQKYERGANRMSCSRLMAIAKALGVAPDRLLPPADWLQEAPTPQWTGEMSQLYLKNERLFEALLDLTPRQLGSLYGVADVFRDPEGTREAG